MPWWIGIDDAHREAPRPSSNEVEEADQQLFGALLEGECFKDLSSCAQWHRCLDSLV